MADWNRNDRDRDFYGRDDRSRRELQRDEDSDRYSDEDYGDREGYRGGGFLGGDFTDRGAGRSNFDRDYGTFRRPGSDFEEVGWGSGDDRWRRRDFSGTSRDEFRLDRTRGDFTPEGHGYASGNIGGGYGTIGGGGGTGMSREYGVGRSRSNSERESGGYRSYGTDMGRDFGMMEGYGTYDRTRDVGRERLDRDEHEGRGLMQRIKESFRGKGPKGYRRSDERIREDVSERLEEDHDVDASDIEVRVADGVVTLSGTVRDRWQKRRAEDIAERATAVRDVQNEIRLAHDAGERTSPTFTGSTTGVTSTGITGTTETGGTARGATTPRNKNR